MKQTRRLDLFLDQKPNTLQVLLYSTKLQSRKKHSEHTRKQRCLQVCLLICPSSSVCLLSWLSVGLSVCLPVCLQLSVCNCLSATVCLSVCLSVCLPVCLCLCHSLWRRVNARNVTFITHYGGQFTFSTLSKHVCLSACLSARPSVCFSACQSVRAEQGKRTLALKITFNWPEHERRFQTVRYWLVMETKYCEELLLPNLIFLNNKETQRYESSVN